MAGRARISVTLPPALVEAADARARALDRSRSWVVAEALRQYLGPEPHEDAGAPSRASLRVAEAAAAPYGAPGLGEYRVVQLEADLALTPEERVRAAEETARVTEALAPRYRAHRLLLFDRYEDYLEWKRGEALAP